MYRAELEGLVIKVPDEYVTDLAYLQESIIAQFTARLERVPK